jgi:uncharacterized protein
MGEIIGLRQGFSRGIYRADAVFWRSFVGKFVSIHTRKVFQMGYSMYEASVPLFSHMLKNLLNIINKARAHAQAKNIDETVFASARLYPDMLPFTRQVGIACDNAKGAAARLTGTDAPVHADDQVSLADCAERVQTVLDYLSAFKPEQFAGAEEREITIPLRSGPLQFKGKVYLQNFATPNFYFHVTTAYDLLRHNGVELGKRDFLGG